jgi:hypothetical protein
MILNELERLGPQVRDFYCLCNKTGKEGEAREEKKKRLIFRGKRGKRRRKESKERKQK